MLSDMLSGFVKVIYWTGLIFGLLLVLAVVGAVNQHVKLTSMAAVGDGLGNVFGWLGTLLSKGLSHL